MKLLLNLLILPWLSLIHDNLEDRTLKEMYEAGRRTVNEIVVENGFEETLKGSSYCGFWIGPSIFLIIKEGESSYEIYQGERGKGVLRTYKCALDDERLSTLFAWKEGDGVVYEGGSGEYEPLYWYFILYDKNHDKKLEFNVMTMNAFRRTQESVKDNKSLPFTDEQFSFLIKLTLPEFFE